MAIISRTYGKFLAILLSWLGFSAALSSCTKYGCPDGEIKIQITGSAASEENATPIQGIRAVLKDDYHGYDTAYTAKNGGFFLQYPYATCKGDERDLYIELQDVDGEANGSFENTEIPVKSKANQNLGIIKMTPKE